MNDVKAAGQNESKKESKVSRRNFVALAGAGVMVVAVALAGIESILNSKSAATVVTSTVPGPTVTIPGPTVTSPGPTTTMAGSTTTVPGPTTTVAGPTITETSTVTNTVTSTVTTTAAAEGFPKVKVVNLANAKVNTPITFNYPLKDEPSLLVKLGQKAQGGVGPDGDIVAFSVICQHLGCQASFTAVNPDTSQPPGPVLICPCHGSVYDLLNLGNVLAGPAPLPVPQVELAVDSSGDIYAYAMAPPIIFGHGSGNNVLLDLQG